MSGLIELIRRPFFMSGLVVMLMVPEWCFSQQKTPPKLVVGIVVDQFRNEYLDRYWNKFGDGGFKKLIGEGFYCKNTHYNYIPTFTGPGHASVYTGTTPAVHGIIANHWYDRTTDRMRYCVADSTVQGLGSDAPAGARSPMALLSTTVTDELRLATNMRSKVVGVSIKDRSAIFPAGHHPTGAYWFDPSIGGFISSTWYGESLPKWVNKFNGKEWTQKYLSKPWETLLPLKSYTESLQDDNPYEGVIAGEEKPVFPHDLPGLLQQNGFGLVSQSPFGNDLVLEMGLATIKGEKMGKDEWPDVLAISFSSTDIIGHRYGPGSIEVEDAFLRLDKNLERLFKFLDKEVGKGEYVVFITGDHGANEVPAFLKDHQMPGDYFNPAAFEKYLDQEMNQILGEGDWIANVSNEQVFLNRSLIQEKKLPLTKISRQVAELALRYPGVSRAVSFADLHTRTPGLGKEQLLYAGYSPSLSGEVLVMYHPGWMDYGNKGTSHGSGYTYDTHVPLIWMGKDIPKGTSYQYTPITAIAPTLSFLLNVPLPNGADLHPVLPILEK